MILIYKHDDIGHTCKEVQRSLRIILLRLRWVYRSPLEVRSIPEERRRSWQNTARMSVETLAATQQQISSIVTVGNNIGLNSRTVSPVFFGIFAVPSFVFLVFVC